jgi:hypothetical protein
MTDRQLRLTPPPEPAELARRLRVIVNGMRACQLKGDARPVLDGDVCDIEDAADALAAIEYEQFDIECDQADADAAADRWEQEMRDDA